MRANEAIPDVAPAKIGFMNPKFALYLACWENRSNYELRPNVFIMQIQIVKVKVPNIIFGKSIPLSTLLYVSSLFISFLTLYR